MWWIFSGSHTLLDTLLRPMAIGSRSGTGHEMVSAAGCLSLGCWAGRDHPDTLKPEAKQAKQDRISNTELGLFLFLPCGNINEKYFAALNRRCLLLWLVFCWFNACMLYISFHFLIFWTVPGWAEAWINVTMAFTLGGFPEKMICCGYAVYPTFFSHWLLGKCHIPYDFPEIPLNVTELLYIQTIPII